MTLTRRESIRLQWILGAVLFPSVPATLRSSFTSRTGITWLRAGEHQFGFGLTGSAVYRRNERPALDIDVEHVHTLNETREICSVSLNLHTRSGYAPVLVAAACT
ncbi:hypothetical protein BDZ89DRAFT_1146357 [Hymenopellis radicata]|nr:hypothetical protein BDZ89DRAFT_1146352 [Hymenopellis radicata]KAF9002804.1 hypothetical protein BDZ89DRAFT_1146357 [Hymenopellis radicata]